jgi:hypothetical protein
VTVLSTGKPQEDAGLELSTTPSTLPASSPAEKTAVEKFLFPDQEELPDDFSMPIWDHLDELRERVVVGAIAAAIAVVTCFCYSKDLVVFLEAPVASQGVRFLQLSPGEFFFTTFKVHAHRNATYVHVSRSFLAWESQSLWQTMADVCVVWVSGASIPLQAREAVMT